VFVLAVVPFRAAVVSLKDLALSVTRGFELELVLQQGASHAGHLRAKAQVVMHAPDPEECKGEGEEQTTGCTCRSTHCPTLLPA